MVVACRVARDVLPRMLFCGGACSIVLLMTSCSTLQYVRVDGFTLACTKGYDVEVDVKVAIAALPDCVGCK